MTTVADGPLLSETVDRRAGRVRVSGHLTGQGADLVRGTVEGLLRSGHARVVVDLWEVLGADEEGLSLLRRLRSDPAVRVRP